MASTFAGGSSSISHQQQQQQGQAGAIPPSMLGFGPAPSSSPYYGSGLAGTEQNQRLQYYQTPQHQAPPATEKIAGRRTGKVKFFDTQKGFGFINDYRAEELGNEEVFVHYTCITTKSGFRSLAEGEEAEYEIVRGPKGFQAANVTGPGGAQVLGDNRRNTKNTYLPISPYATMYPYIQQDPSAFYASASPYNQAMMLMPQTDYRNPPPAHHHHPSAAAAAAAGYRNINVSPYAAVNPALSPYGSPGPLRGFDIGKDFGGMSLGGLSVDEGLRGNKSGLNSSQSAAQMNSGGGGGGAPFGGMFGSIPSFDAPGPGLRTGGAPFAQQSHGQHYQQQSQQQHPSQQQQRDQHRDARDGHSGNPNGPNSSAGLPNGGLSARSGSLDSGDNKVMPSGLTGGGNREREESSSSGRPQTLHSRSSSLLYGTATGGTGKSAGIPSA